MENISEHISYKEATKSITALNKGIDNTPGVVELKRMKYVANEVFERIRAKHGAPIGVASFYRSPTLNKAVGGSPASYHCLGAAIDIDADIFGGLTNRDLIKFIYENCKWSELIYEYPDKNWKDCEWVHVALVEGVTTRKVKVAQAGEKTRYMTDAELARVFG